ncbi:hypothetical protein O1611_g1391 [Lasiodiplodia mahajangana]|uniref:Uncharacterized protein n=1 Tax=Lasiodiplodia mahajangana TaxID=1108764 RepID=A0ACC2JXI0_9PEZI|nr:hypothetical protein O1611_g1391 [Lasiodiplodia mahajangana]
MVMTPGPQDTDSQTPDPISANEAIHNTVSDPRQATGANFYTEDRRRRSVRFKFCSDPSKLYALRCQKWIAFLDVKCDDVPRLMREGFFWDASNAIQKEGFLTVENKSHANDWSGASTRWYFLTDTRQDRLWVASLTVRATDLNVLYNFKLSQLSRELVRSVWASNQDGREIYGYQAYTSPDLVNKTPESPMMGFNVIYDGMPMEGFWPWPRKENNADTKEFLENSADEAVSGSSRRSQDEVRSTRNFTDVEVKPKTRGTKHNHCRYRDEDHSEAMEEMCECCCM